MPRYSLETILLILVLLWLLGAFIMPFGGDLIHILLVVILVVIVVRVAGRRMGFVTRQTSVETLHFTSGYHWHKP